MMGDGGCQAFPSAQTCPESLQRQRGFVSFHVLSMVMCLQPMCHDLNKPRKPLAQYEKEEADPIPDLTDTPAPPLHRELLQTPCAGARLWRHSQRWGGQAEEVSHLFFQAVFVKIGHGRLHLLLPRRFAVHWAGSEHGAGWVSTALCVAPPVQNAPCSVCTPRNARACL